MRLEINNVVFLAAINNDNQLIRQALIELAENTRQEPGCIHFNFYQYQENVKKFILFEQFRDQVAMEQHLDADYSKLFFSKNLLTVESIHALDNVSKLISI